MSDPIHLLDLTNVIIMAATVICLIWLKGALFDGEESATEIVTKRDD